MNARKCCETEALMHRDVESGMNKAVSSGAPVPGGLRPDMLRVDIAGSSTQTEQYSNDSEPKFTLKNLSRLLR